MPRSTAPATKIAVQINSQYAAFKDQTQSLNQNAVKTGELLLEAKKIVGHGNFGPWLTENCRVSERHAQRFMSLAKHRDELAEANPTWMSDLTMADALDMLRDMKSQKEQLSERKAADHDGVRRDPETLREAHSEHVKEYRTLANARKPKPSQVEVRKAVHGLSPEFAESVSPTLAKRARVLARRVVKQVPKGTHPDVIAMLLIDELKGQLSPEKLLAPDVPEAARGR